MPELTEIIQKRFDGFLQTNYLWKNQTFYGLKQFEIAQNFIKFNTEINKNLRLGKYIERFVSFQLQQNNSVILNAENVQIQQEKRTLGELDCILQYKETPIHLEIIYKFYLFDTSVGKTEIEHCIGPNRKDTLIEKLTKLKTKQLPLLYTQECKKFLETLNLDSKDIEQRVYFKAQIFIPLNKKVKFKILNSDCITGFYIYKEEIQQFKDCKFYIPIKKDWLIIPHTKVKWQNFDNFFNETLILLENKFSPLCWIKHRNGVLEKFFLVWK